MQFKMLLASLILCLAQIATAQSKYYLSVVKEAQGIGTEYITEQNRSRLETKLLKILTKNNIGAIGKEYPLVIYPKLEIVDEIVQEGIENLFFVKTDITFIVKNSKSNMVYATYTETTRGSGNTRHKAINNAIAKLSTASVPLDRFLTQTEEKIVTYFEEQCSSLIETAKSLADRQLFEKTFKTLESIPINSSCYTTALDLAKDVFIQSQQPICQSILRTSKTYLLQGKYQQAMNTIAQIKYGTPCDQEFDQLLNELREEQQYKEIRANDEAFYLQIKKYEIELERIRQQGRRYLPNYISGLMKEFLMGSNLLQY